jgi:serine/threonine protein phosphatase 1
MPKFFVVSDVHSFYTPLIESLNTAGFDKNNEDHWLISCGDLFDRGDESTEVLDFIQSLPRKILIKGNHEYLFEEMCKRKIAYSHDIHNGTVKTVRDLCGNKLPLECYLWPAYNNFDKDCLKAKKLTKEYFRSLVPYFETEKYIFVHSTLPVWTKNSSTLVENWRNADAYLWEQATWGNPFVFFQEVGAVDGKTVVFGHWHTSWARCEYDNGAEFGDNVDFSIYKGDGYIGIDSCTAYSGKVNVLVIEDNFVTE